ncbi:MAG: 30S ribosomal protein S15 [Patescibacteria group bacterium]
MLDKTAKDRIIKKYKTHEGDTGSPEVQIAILSYEITHLTDHLKTHKKDFSSRRGLLKKVGQRRRLMVYLQREDNTRFEELAKKLKLKAQTYVIPTAPAE